MSGRMSFVRPSQFIGRPWWAYLVPRRITLASNPPVYRWLCWNFGRSGEHG